VSHTGPDASQTLHLRIEGRVQGVGFRRFVERTATALGLAGWARNLTDGSVEVLAVGPRAALDTLRERLALGPPYATVGRLIERPAPDRTADLPPFRLLPDADPGAPIPPRHERR
jgi:acylphosphatase